MNEAAADTDVPGAGLDFLRGVRVIDFTQALSGPYRTMILADLDADVIKVEAPVRGDDARAWGAPFTGVDAAYFMSVNRNKRSVAPDLKQPVGLAAACQLIATADVIVENWRPSTPARLGLDPDTLRIDNPDLGICSISGYGQDRNPRAGHDLIVKATSGVRSLTGPAGRPTKWGVPAGDIAAGRFSATAIVASLYERRESGRGRDLDITMQDSLISMLTHQATRYLATGQFPPKDYSGHSTIVPCRMFDGYINIRVGNDGQFQRMCAALDLPELGLDERFRTKSQRLAHKRELLALISTRLRTLTGPEAIDRLEQGGVPVGAVNDLAEVLDAPEVRRRQTVLPIARDGYGSAEVVNRPWIVDGCISAVDRQPPGLGEHTEEILAELLETSGRRA